MDQDLRPVFAQEALSKITYPALDETPELLAAVPTKLGAVSVYNPDATDTAFVQLFDVADDGDVTLGTTPPDEVIAVLAGTSAVLAGAAAYDNGVVLAATATATGSGAPSTELVVSVRYR